MLWTFGGKESKDAEVQKRLVSSQYNRNGTKINKQQTRRDGVNSEQ